MNLKFDQRDVLRLQAAAAKEPRETVAVALVARSAVDGRESWVVRQLTDVPEHAYASRTDVSATLTPAFCMELANLARGKGCGVLFAHTHPGDGALVSFSTTDDQGEEALSRYFNSRVPHRHFSAVLTVGSVTARVLGHDGTVDVQVVGPTIQKAAALAAPTSAVYDRQVRAFGEQGQQQLSQAAIGIVGLGGTGSLVAQQAAYLGFGEFVLVDPDVVEETNLNRIVGATGADIGCNKVDVAARHILAINPKARVRAIAADVLSAPAQALLGTDLTFGCTDSMASRALLNQLAYQHYVPVIDMGVAIHAENHKVSHVVGRVQMLAPGIACLACTGKLDAEQIRRELMTEAQRRADPYIVGEKVVQPAVISLNSVVASAAVSMAAAAIAGFPGEARGLNYDGIRGSLRPFHMAPQAGCIVCSAEGALGRGATWTLPARVENHG